ncbi:MAG: Fic family protein [Propioniciclava sp.]
MDLELFQKGASGALVPIVGLTDGRPWEHHAFLPDPLGPVSPDLDGTAYRAVAEARSSIAALDATAQRLPNPQLFRDTTLRLEAQSTAALEGTYEPLERVLSADADEDTTPSIREVLNYLTVAAVAFSTRDDGRRWSVSWLAELQALLLRGTPGEREHSGEVRPIQVVVGRRPGVPVDALPVKAARYVPPPPGPDLTSRLRDLLEWMQADHRELIDPVVAAAMGHYLFEALHPFHDGNGRLGRLLIILHLQAQGILTEPTLSVSPWFEARRSDYYDALLAVSTDADWSRWITFFARGIASSAEGTRARMVALVDVQRELKEQLRATRSRGDNAQRLIDFAVAQPTFTATQAATNLGLTPTGTKKIIDSLVDYGILAPWDQQVYRRRFHAPRVMQTLLNQSGTERH